MYATLLTWTYTLSDNTGFLLQRSIDSGLSWTTNYTLDATASSYIDNDVLLAHTYWYRIAAINKYGTGSFSDTGSIFIPYGIPNPPSELEVSSGSAILSWTPGIPDQNHSIQDYYTIRKSTDGNIFSDFNVSLVDNFTDEDVTSSPGGNTYWYSVASVNSAGTSSFSNTASITFVSPENPIEPLNEPPQGIPNISGSIVLEPS
ncbi:MAG TPA: fibronectin type III domain-containing protein [Bacteroidales bacterium]|nr:fibronectin type III domain-containing protein [Bacteroidales bacterium]